MTSSAAIAIVVRPPLGSRIWPLLVNGPSRDPPLRAIVEAGRRSGRAAAASSRDAQRLVGAVEQEIEPRPLDPPVEHQLAAGHISPAARAPRCGRCRRVRRMPAARQPQLGRIELQVGEMEDPVGRPLEVGLEPRQAAGQLAEEAVVEPPHPGLGRCRSPGCPCRGPAARRELGRHVDDPEAGDQVARQPARHEDLEPPGDAGRSAATPCP